MKKYLFLLLLLVSTGFVSAQSGRSEIVIKDADITATSGTVNWTKDNVYVLDGYVYVEAPTVLNIEAGTVIKAKETPSTGDVASVLIITRGAKIYAEGTPTQPIIFTSEYDNTDLPDDGTDPGVDFRIDRGLWGGVVLLGKSVLNVANEKVVEGLPATDVRALYGGNDDADNSGVMKYVSIRYTGITVEANKELQGLTVACVGSGTTLEYIETFTSDDDGFEFFGGTVNTKYLISAFATDDAFDYDQGFRGMHQFWFAIQSDSNGVGDHLGEFDSGDSGALTNEPLSQPVIYNATFIGKGANSPNSGDIAINYKEYGGGEFYNSIFTDFDKTGIKVDSGSGLTSYDRLMNGGIKLENNIWFKSEGNTISNIAAQSFVQNYLLNTTNNNSLVNPLLYSIGRDSDMNLDPRPQASSPAYTLATKAFPAGNTFYSEADYYGAFDTDIWMNGWTALYQNKITNQIFTSVEGNKTEIPSDFELSQNYPNPFNPTTKINFSLPKDANVRLTVYNVLGQEVATLLQGYKSAGNYTVDFNAAGLASGLYVYRLDAGNAAIVKKMTLLK